MKMFGAPYRITSTVTALKPNEVIEWRHPVGHRWRWKFESLSPTLTYTLIGARKSNASGIEATLAKLRDRYAVR